MKTEFKAWLTAKLLDWAFSVCPKGEFKIIFAFFLRDNIMKL